MIIIFFPFMAGILTTVIILYILCKNFFKSNNQVLLNSIEEAGKVKKDLEELMESCLDLSKNIIQDMEERIQSSEPSPPEQKFVKSQNLSRNFANNINDAYNGIYIDNTKEPEADPIFTEAPSVTITDNQAEIFSPAETATDKNNTPDTLEDLKSVHPYIAVKTLLDRGYSVKQIAQLLNRGQGEINLIINLINKKISYPN